MQAVRSIGSAPADAEARFQAECDVANQTRLRAVLAVMFVVHLFHVWAFWVGDAEMAALEPGIVAWREAVVAVHVVTAVVVAALIAGSWTVPTPRIRVVAWLAGTTYLLHGAATAAADQLHNPMVTPYLAYAMVIGMLLILEPIPAALMYAIGVVAYFAALFGFQPDPEIRRSMILNGPSVTVAAMALSVFLQRARRRDFMQRATIAQQAEQLEGFNRDLEQRVADQVDEIVRHSEEVEALNAQLQQQVQDRSRELAKALERLSDDTLDGQTMIGTVLGGRFELLARIGAGGMGTVYEGVDRTTERRVAVKVVRPDLGAPVGLLRRFLREAEAVASLSHPNIVKMLHVDIAEDGTFFQVQELVPGQTLSELLTRHGRFGAAATTRVLEALARALEAAHASGVVHRDVKPGNVMLVREEPGLKLLDFGVAKFRAALAEQRREMDLPTGFQLADPDEPLTEMGAVLGTPGFMGPEQARGREVTSQADLYALGVVGYLLLTGDRPRRDAKGHPETPLGTVVPLAPPGLLRCIDACLAPLPDDRPEASSVVGQLAAVAQELDAAPLHVLVATDAVRSTASDADPTLTGVVEPPDDAV